VGPRSGPPGRLTVTSVSNERAKFMMRLSNPSFRRRTGCSLVEGVRLIGEALNSGADFVTAAYDGAAARSRPVRELVGRLERRGVEVWETSRGILRAVALTETPQGVVAAIRVRSSTESDVIEVAAGKVRESGDAMVALMDGVQDPGNAGTIVRSADAFGAACVVFAGPSADPYNPKVLRASMGSVFHVTCVSVGDASSVLVALRDAGFRVFYGDPRSPREVYRERLTGPIVLAVGNETAGVSEAVRHHGTGVCVPIRHGKAESLNAAMAFTAMAYEARRQRVFAL
jgi:TrmH family RNA methyltransferase